MPQTAEDIAEIVRQAQNPPASPAGWDQDEYIGAPLHCTTSGSGEGLEMGAGIAAFDVMHGIKCIAQLRMLDCGMDVTSNPAVLLC